MVLHQDKTRQEWVDEINASQIDDVIVQLLDRIYRIEPRLKFQRIDGKIVYSYDTLEMENKPDISVFEDELAQWKVDRLAEINSLFDILDAKEALRVRIDNLLDARISASAVSGMVNGQVELNRIVAELDEAAMAELEAHDATYRAEVNAKNQQRQERLDVVRNADFDNLQLPEMRSLVKAMAEILGLR